ncbi:MAG: division plane positioning ATPase MipZ [Rickettsiaceae bacterium]
MNQNEGYAAIRKSLANNDNSFIRNDVRAKNNPYIFIVGNEKGGVGKTTCSIHLITYLLNEGYKVTSIDTDSRQASLTKYIQNRQEYNQRYNANPVSCPNHAHIECKDEQMQMSKLLDAIQTTGFNSDYIVIDTPGNYSSLSKLAHSYADTVITPINDSLLDIDVIANIDPENHSIISPSIYSQMLWEQKLERMKRDQKPIEWILLRNRLSNIHAKNKQIVSQILEKLSKRIGFKVAPAFSERVIFKELFLQGLTLADLPNANTNKPFSISHVAARQELRDFIEYCMHK